MKTCWMADCNEPHIAYGLCMQHLLSWTRACQPSPQPPADACVGPYGNGDYWFRHDRFLARTRRLDEITARLYGSQSVPMAAD